MCAADARLSGTAPETVWVRKEYEDERDAEVEGRAEVTSHTASQSSFPMMTAPLLLRGEFYFAENLLL
jgi:hypothetical protein